MHKFAISFLLLLSVLISACSPSTADGKAIYFQDDFSNVDSGWTRDTFTEGLTDYDQDSYRILVNETYYSIWSYIEHGSQADVSIEADTRKIGGDDVNEFGIVCRHLDTDNFYVGVITSDGYYGFLKTVNGGDFEVIGSDTFSESPAINQGSNGNHMRMDCVGDTLTLYANEQMLGQVTDSTITNGVVGLYAGTYDIGGTDILFDNFVVHAP